MSERLFENVGRRSIAVLDELGYITFFFIQSFYVMVTTRLNFRNTYEQMVKIGVESLPVALVTSFFVGMVFAVQIANEFSKFGAGKMVGGVMAIAVARELAPVLTAVVVAGRVGAAIAAELGTMNVTQQIDAMKSLGTNPVRYLVVPRLVAACFMLPIATLFADVVGFAGAYLVSVYVAGINSYGFMETADMFLKTWDITGGLIKAVVFGAIISILACHKGLHAKNGAKGVGEATTGSVVLSLITIFITNYFLSVLIFKK